nr:zinc finger, CCHC-type, retrotransposon Gag domain protein [Tanacetum cinerariifolium]
AEQERLKREYHSIRQTSTETSTEFMHRFLRFAGFLGAAAGTKEEQAKIFQWGLRRSTLNHLICMSYTDMAQVANAARATVIITTVMDLTGEVVVTTTTAATTTTLAVTTGIPVMGTTRETGVSSPTDLPVLILSSPGVPLRDTPIQFALLADVDTQESVVELQ